MKWLEIPLYPTPRVLRQFAGGWLVCVSALGAHQWLVRHRPELGPILIAAGFLVGLLGLVRPQAIRWLFVAATVVAFPLGWIVSQVALGLMFYFIITPVAALFRWRGRDLLARKAAPERSTFWEEKPSAKNLRSYFRQY